MNDASKSRKSPSAPHETPNITAPVRGKRVAPLSCTPIDGRWISALRLPARPQFTVSEIEEYMTKTLTREGKSKQMTSARPPSSRASASSSRSEVVLPTWQPRTRYTLMRCGAMEDLVSILTKDLTVLYLPESASRVLRASSYSSGLRPYA
jgi:hypothetical protein